MKSHDRYIPTTNAASSLVSIYAWREPDDGLICAYVVTDGTVSDPGVLRGFSWDDTETAEAGAALAAVVLAWVHRTTMQQPLPFD